MKRLFAVAALLAAATSAHAASQIGAPEICKAGIGVVMGRKPAIMSLDGASGGVYAISYTRDDGTPWSYRCRLEGNRIMWATSTGRWRNDPQDETLIYTISPDKKSLAIKQTFSDGSATDESYSASDF